MNALQIAASSSPSRRSSPLRTVASPPSRQASATMVAKFQGLLLDEDTALPVAAALTLADTIARSTAKTLYQLCREVRAASETLQQWKRAQPIDTRCGRLNAISLRAGCELFLQYVTRASLDIPDFDDCREVLRQRGEHFASLSKRSRDKIAASTLDFIHQGSVVLVFGYSRVVIKSLLRVAQSGRQFRVIAMEGRPEANGWKTARALQDEGGIDVSVIVDAAMGFVLEEVDMVLVGAEAVVESGGIVNQVGFLRHCDTTPVYASLPLPPCTGTLTRKRERERERSMRRAAAPSSHHHGLHLLWLLSPRTVKKNASHRIVDRHKCARRRRRRAVEAVLRCCRDV